MRWGNGAPRLSIPWCDELHSEQETLNSAGSVLLPGTQPQPPGVSGGVCTSAGKPSLLFSCTLDLVLKKGTVRAFNPSFFRSSVRSAGCARTGN